MNLGTIIRKLRREKDLTQEQLAEYLNISVSAVSQWESGKTSPDLSLLVPLANFFEVSLDVLFERGTEARERELEQFREQAKQCSHDGDVPGEIAVWREAVRQFPGNFECLHALARALTFSVDSAEDAERGKEAVDLLERILRDCTDSPIRKQAIFALVHLYANPELPFADEGKAVEYAKMGDPLFHCADFLLTTAYFTEESAGKRLRQLHLNNLNLTDQLCMNLFYHHGKTPEERIFACETALKLWNALIYDGNFLFFHCRLQKIYQILANAHAELGHRTETVEAIRQALYHAEQYDAQPAEERHYTSVFVSAMSENAGGTTKNFTESNAEIVRMWMKSKRFDFVRGEIG